MIGEQLGHYRIVSQLGRGGMATVYLAEQAGLDRRVALKLLHPALAVDETIVQRFLREARIAANLQHPHIVTIHDVGDSDGIYYIAMRYIQGESLGQLLHREGPLEPSRALAMLAQIADALDFAHAHDVLHRDIKPANVMVEPDDFVTLTDFGIARAGEQSRLTSTHMVIGTPQYMSPEQARGDPVDKRTDLYALGVLLYEMLGGRPPFTAANTPSLLYLHIHEPPPPLHELCPEVPLALGDVVTKALAKEPSERFQSGREMVAAAQAALAAKPDATPAVTEKITAAVTATTTVAPVRQTAPTGLIPPAPLSSRTALAGTIVVPRPPGGTPAADAARADTRPLRSPPGVSRGDQTVPVLPITRPGELRRHHTGWRRSTIWPLGPVVVVVALLLARILIASTSGLLVRTTPTATAIVARPTAPTRSAPTAPVAVIRTVPSRPTEAPPALVPSPTQSPPTAVATPAVPPPTPGPTDRMVTAQGAVGAGDYATAIAELEAVRRDPGVQSDPTLASVVAENLRKSHLLYGNQLLERGQLDDSYAQFGEALKITPNDPDALNGQTRVVLIRNYAVMEANWGKDDDRAIQALEENMTLDPGFRETRQKLYALLITRADHLLVNGDRDGAFPVLMRALEVVPERPEARQRLASYTPTPAPPPTQRPYVPPPTPRPYVPPPTQPPYVPPSGPFVPPGSPV